MGGREEGKVGRHQVLARISEEWLLESWLSTAEPEPLTVEEGVHLRRYEVPGTIPGPESFPLPWKVHCKSPCGK